MNRLLYSLIFSSFCSFASSQQNHYFLDNARWVYQTEKSYEPGQITIYSGLEENTILGDTILNGVAYKKLYKRFKHFNTVTPPLPNQGSTTISYESKGPMFMRYEASENKVYFKESADSSEVVIYDFNIGLGDTIALRSEYFSDNTVKRMDTISVLGINQTFFVLDTLYTPVRNGIISGLGSLNGLTYFQPRFEALSGGILMTDLVCFEYNNSTFKSLWAEQNQTLCPSLTDFISSSKDVAIEPITIVPNPNNGTFHIQIPEIHIGSLCTIFNSNGQKVNSIILQEKHTTFYLNTKGLHYYMVGNHHGKMISGKVLILE